MIKDKRALVLEVVGTLFIIFLGTALHFTFASSGNNPIVGSFSAVNESVWEHLKMPFWASIFWLLITTFLIRKNVSNFFSAKAVGIILMLVIIPVVFYSYTAFTKEILAVDIATFIITVVIGQAVSLALYRQQTTARTKWFEIAGLTTIIVLAVMFVAFTFYPPHLQIFFDTEACRYGIP